MYLTNWFWALISSMHFLQYSKSVTSRRFESETSLFFYSKFWHSNFVSSILLSLRLSHKKKMRLYTKFAIELGRRCISCSKWAVRGCGWVGAWASVSVEGWGGLWIIQGIVLQVLDFLSIRSVFSYFLLQGIAELPAVLIVLGPEIIDLLQIQLDVSYILCDLRDLIFWDSNLLHPCVQTLV